MRARRRRDAHSVHAKKRAGGRPALATWRRVNQMLEIPDPSLKVNVRVSLS
jgi:hypothetical protein